MDYRNHRRAQLQVGTLDSHFWRRFGRLSLVYYTVHSFATNLKFIRKFLRIIFCYPLERLTKVLGSSPGKHAEVWLKSVGFSRNWIFRKYIILWKVPLSIHCRSEAKCALKHKTCFKIDTSAVRKLEEEESDKPSRYDVSKYKTGMCRICTLF